WVMKAGILKGNEVAARLATVGRIGKLASQGPSRPKPEMRHIVPLPVLFVAACAPRPEPTPQPVVAAPATSSQHDHRTVNGMTANELIQHFGKPRLQIVEGDGTRLQFAGPNCMLDV